jgi:hypothetical protein
VKDVSDPSDLADQIATYQGKVEIVCSPITLFNEAGDKAACF